MVMSSSILRHYMEGLYGPKSPPYLNTIRIGTKSLAWWPYRYVTDPDAKATLDLFSEIVKSGKHLAIQAHFSHPREAEHPVAQEAIRLIRMTGGQIRSQAPLIRQVNDDANLWEHMWKTADEAWHNPLLHVCRARHWRSRLLLRAACESFGNL